MIRQRTVLGKSSLAGLISFMFILYPLLTGCSGDTTENAAKGNGKMVPVVEAIQAKSGSLPLTERLSGLVKAENQVELHPQISASVAELYVHNGEIVKAGDPLVRLRDTEFREQLKQAEANYQIALAQAKQAEAENKQIQAEFERSTTLSEKNLISATEYEAIQTRAISAEASAELARARVEQARAVVDQRKEELSHTIIRAPVDGTVGNRNAEIGMLVTPSTKLFTLGQLDSLRVEVVLSDRMLAYIKEDQRSEILSQAIHSGSLIAPVARISPFLHPVTHSTIAEIDLANPDGALKPGMFVAVDIFYGESEQTTLVPLSAVWENPATATTGVFVCRDSLSNEPGLKLAGPRRGALTNPLAFQFVPVEVVAKGRMNAGVRGVEPGSWVVTIGQELLGADTARARVHPVNWEWIEDLQQLQREDLLEDVMRRQQSEPVDTSQISDKSNGHEGGA